MSLRALFATQSPTRNVATPHLRAGQVLLRRTLRSSQWRSKELNVKLSPHPTRRNRLTTLSVRIYAPRVCRARQSNRDSAFARRADRRADALSQNADRNLSVLEGTGQMELDGACVPVKPMTAIMIQPGCRHRAVGKLRIAIIPIPAFDPADEWFD